MGSLCSSCFKSGSQQELISPDMETRRRQQAEAAERRAKMNESRGLANPERVQRKIEQALAREERMEKAMSENTTPVLKWQAT